MSWPADGKPRYKLTEIAAGHGDRYPEFYVLDRANCHAIVWRSHQGNQYHEPTRAEARHMWERFNLLEELTSEI